MSTFFALVTIPKEQLKGSKSKSRKTSSFIPTPCPTHKYETEQEVTLAIAEGRESGFGASELYREAKEYQKWLKAQQFHGFKKQAGKSHPLGLNFRPGYAN